MEPLPDLYNSVLPQLFNSSEKALLEELKYNFKTSVIQAIEEIKDRLSVVASETVQKLSSSFNQEIIQQAELLLKSSLKSINLNLTKKFIDSICASIDNLDRLIFLSRYFNSDNDANYLKELNSRVSIFTSAIYNFNNYVNSWTKYLLDNIQLDPKDFLAVLVDPKQKERDAVSTDLFLVIKFTKSPFELNQDLVNYIDVDYYTLLSTFKNLRKTTQNYISNNIPQKIRLIVDELSSGKGASSPALIQLGEGFIKSNPLVTQLEGELQKLKNCSDDLTTLDYLLLPKNRLDEIITDTKKYEDEIEIATTKYVSQALARKEETNPNNEQIPIEKMDEVIVEEIQNFCVSPNENIKSFLNEWINDTKTEITRLFDKQKEVLKNNISAFLEERLVVFHQGKGDFATSNFMKLVQDFCIAATKDFKKVVTAQNENDHDIWPLYFCYIAENLYDFYLVEYFYDSIVLRVYLTAAPMLSTLSKHLSKLDMNKISKKNVLVSVLNYYDADINMEFRQVFLNQAYIDPDFLKQNKVSQGFKDLIFITIFLINNLIATNLSSPIQFTTKDFALFFNYVATYNTVFNEYRIRGDLPNMISSPRNKVSSATSQGSELSPTIRVFSGFEFHIPFIDLRQPKVSFLLHPKGSVARESSNLNKKSIEKQYDDMHHYESLSHDDNEDQVDSMKNEVFSYLKHNERKAQSYFDGIKYLLTYLLKLESDNGSIKIISKTESKKLYDLYKVKENEDLLTHSVQAYSKYENIYIILPLGTEDLSGLMIKINFTNSTLSIFLPNVENKSENWTLLEEFAHTIATKIRPEETSLLVRRTTCFINEDILKYFKSYYYPYTCLFDSISTRVQSSSNEINIAYEQLHHSFQNFLSLLIMENSLEIFKICNLNFEESSKHVWQVVNLNAIIKFHTLKSTIDGWIEKVILDKTKHTLISFSLVSPTGNKVFYLHLEEIIDKGGIELESPVKPNQTQYLLDLFTLSQNIGLDDQEIITILSSICQSNIYSNVIFNKAYSVPSRHNILLHNQIDLTMNTLMCLVHFTGISLSKAFQKIYSSIISHYDTIETLIDRVCMLNQTGATFTKHRTLSAPLKSDALEFGKNKIPVAHLTPSIRVGLLKKSLLLDSFFTSYEEEIKFKKDLEEEAMQLLQSDYCKHFTGGIDIYSLLNLINCEETPQQETYSFIVDEQVMKKLLGNDASILKNISKFLIDEVNASKVKFEETLEFKYSRTQLFFLISENLFKRTKVLFISYNLEAALINFYYVRVKLPSQVQLDENEEELRNLDNQIKSIEEIDELQNKNDPYSKRSLGHLGYVETTQSRDYNETEEAEVMTRREGFDKDSNIDNEPVYENPFVPKNLQGLMNNFSQIVTKIRKSKQKPKSSYHEIIFDEALSNILSLQHSLIIKFLIYYLSHEGSSRNMDKIELNSLLLNNFMNDWANKIFIDYIDNSRIKENYKFLCNMFVDKSCYFGKKIALIAFLNGHATPDQTNVLENCIKGFKQDFQKIVGLEHAFFCFSINLKQSMRHFILYISGKNKKDLNIEILTNVTDDSDSILDKLIRVYCLENENMEEDTLINELRMYKLEVTNQIFMSSLEVTTILLANGITKESADFVSYCAHLSYSPIHYLKELRAFEEKCDELGFLHEFQGSATIISQQSPV